MNELLIGLCGGVGVALVNGAVQLLLRRRDRTDQLRDRHEAREDRLAALERQVESLRNSLEAYIALDESRFGEIRQALSDLRDGSIHSLGDIIRGIYHRYSAAGAIPEREKRIADNIFSLYHDKWGANGAIEAMYEEMSCWEVLFDK